ncbi:MAG: hypothetical protein EON50_16410 [Acidovorax sp.]|nr:MAG: hypothetical protein EON50_16410 [Acidovorax sp.]
MNALLKLLAPATRRAKLLVLPLLLALAACGPGTGGTGTGPVNGALNFAGSGFSTGVPCADCGQTHLRLENELVELTLTCRRFVHTGPWEIDAQGLAVVEGTFEATGFANGVAQASTVPAIMRLQFSDALANSREVAVTVRDANGNNLIAPQTLEQRPAAASPTACAAGA